MRMPQSVEAPERLGIPKAALRHARTTHTCYFFENIGHILNYPIIKKGKVRIYRFEILGKETLKTPLGEINTLKIRKIREGSDRETFLWFAPRWNFMLIQLWQHEAGGGDYRMLLENGTLAGKELGSLTTL